MSDLPLQLLNPESQMLNTRGQVPVFVDPGVVAVHLADFFFLFVILERRVE